MICFNIKIVLQQSHVIAFVILLENVCYLTFLLNCEVIFPQVFDSFVNNVFGSISNRALEFCELCLGFEIFSSANLMLVRLNFKLFQSNVLIFLLIGPIEFL
ncbi:uncharacterized protein DS421_10g302140 [Arachis hypogaea]|nr:uncharacterized protein DS421_10g302140 [Arachis hypogaea]